MRTEDADDFKNLLAGVYSLYGKPLSPALVSIWWESMRPYDFAAVKVAINRHAVNPDNGQYLPKPADVVRLIGGGTQDSALIAWTKVQKAVRDVGTYHTVCFDDPIINAVLSDMGGWILHGQVQERELPFKAKEFENRYRAYKSAGGAHEYPRSLPGIYARENSLAGRTDPNAVRMIGNPKAAQLVYRKGGESAQPSFTLLSNYMPRVPEEVAA